MVRTSLIYFCWVGEPQLQIYQGVFILSIAKALFPTGRASGCPTKANAADSFESAGCVSLKRLPVKVSL